MPKKNKPLKSTKSSETVGQIQALLDAAADQCSVAIELAADLEESGKHKKVKRLRPRLEWLENRYTALQVVVARLEKTSSNLG